MAQTLLWLYCTQPQAQGWQLPLVQRLELVQVPTEHPQLHGLVVVLQLPLVQRFVLVQVPVVHPQLHGLVVVVLQLPLVQPLELVQVVHPQVQAVVVVTQLVQMVASPGVGQDTPWQPKIPQEQPGGV